MTRSWKWNPPEEKNSAGNNQILDVESTGEMEFCWELLPQGHGFRPARSKIFRSVIIPGALTLKDLYRIRIILNMKISFK
jgi:hypothetical protein